MNRKIKEKQRAAGRCLMLIAGALLCIVFAGCGDRTRSVSVPVGEPMEGETVGSAAPGAEEAKESSVIYVHVCGAVKTPGVVLLPEGSRGQDALEAAGGFSQDAAENAVNLAKPLADGEKLYFPTREEAESLQESVQAVESGLVNINTAGEELLCTLPGIGEARAKAIVAYREANGDFQKTEDIMRVSGIKDSAFDKIKDLITVQ